MPAWLAALIRKQASREQHHKVKRRALQLMALPIVQNALDMKATEAFKGLSIAGLGSTALSSVQTGALAETPGSQVGPAGTAAQESEQSMRCKVLQDIQARQQQLQDAQHPEVGPMPAQLCQRYDCSHPGMLGSQQDCLGDKEQSMRTWVTAYLCSLRQQQDVPWQLCRTGSPDLTCRIGCHRSRPGPSEAWAQLSPPSRRAGRAIAKVLMRRAAKRALQPLMLSWHLWKARAGHRSQQRCAPRPCRRCKPLPCCSRPLLPRVSCPQLSSHSTARCDNTTGYCTAAALGCWQG